MTGDYSWNGERSRGRKQERRNSQSCDQTQSQSSKRTVQSAGTISKGKILNQMPETCFLIQGRFIWSRHSTGLKEVV